jgi:hypothetical protein
MDKVRPKAENFAGLLEYNPLLYGGILLLSNGSFLAAWEVRGLDIPDEPGTARDQSEVNRPGTSHGAREA